MHSTAHLTQAEVDHAAEHAEQQARATGEPWAVIEQDDPDSREIYPMALSSVCEAEIEAFDGEILGTVHPGGDWDGYPWI